MVGVCWGSDDYLERNVKIAMAYLDGRDAGKISMPVEEGKARNGLRKCLKTLTIEVAKLRSRVRLSEGKLRAVNSKICKIENDQFHAVKSMASGHLSRVGAPIEAVQAVKTLCAGKDIGVDQLIGVCTFAADAEIFNVLYVALRALPREDEWPEWECSSEDALRPEKDLLGMCPGGKPHMTAKQLEARSLSRCFCSLCECAALLASLRKDRSELEKAIPGLLNDLRESEKLKRSTRHVVRRFRSDCDEGVEDPVFYDETWEPTEERVQESHQNAQIVWSQVADTLSVDDFPLKIVFLDKSASMGCDVVTYDALQFAVMSSLNPSHGSTLTLLFAAPGDTEIIFRRPGDQPIQMGFELGSATWFNEPVVRTLRFLAPLVEALDFNSWTARRNEPPLQVLCLTDGEDNCSPSQLKTLGDMVNELKAIVGPATGKKLYTPVTGSFARPTNTAKVPVWLAWIACGMGGQNMLESNACKDICIVDAVTLPQDREPPAPVERTTADKEEQEESKERTVASASQNDEDEVGVLRSTATSRSRQRATAATQEASVYLSQLAASARSRWSIGHRVCFKNGSLGLPPKAGIVVGVVEACEDHPPRYELLLDDESTATVDETELLGLPSIPSSLLSARRGCAGKKGPQPKFGCMMREADADGQRLQVLSIVDAAFRDLGSIMQAKTSETGPVSLEAVVKASLGDEHVQGELASRLEATLDQAHEQLLLSSEPVTRSTNVCQVLLDALISIGRVAWKLMPEDRAVSQRLIYVGVEILVAGGSLKPSQLADQLGIFAGVLESYSSQRMKLAGQDFDAWQAMLIRPLEELLKVLMRHTLLEKSRDAATVLAVAEAKPYLSAVQRLFDPAAERRSSTDILRRAVNRSQRLQPQFSFASKTSARGCGSPRSSVACASEHEANGEASCAAAGATSPVDRGAAAAVSNDDLALCREDVVAQHQKHGRSRSHSLTVSNVGVAALSMPVCSGRPLTQVQSGSPAGTVTPQAATTRRSFGLRSPSGVRSGSQPALLRVGQSSGSQPSTPVHLPSLTANSRSLRGGQPRRTTTLRW
eukprot:TRINITY_DN45411_c0_g1_i1.p1 TRINITY_DN45411_c0_g1~~TRINITY_DN45411_c0_g1_i1.p1  ORF type:complete len:1075 (-),score=171.14 TRINITY_DN45411_c0_g1_i1:90-3251(-)